MAHYPKEIIYSDKFNDDYYEFRNIILTKKVFKRIPEKTLLSENEWRALGIVQSRGWEHFSIHKPEPHVLLFRRPVGTDPETGEVPFEVLFKIEEYERKKAIIDHHAEVVRRCRLIK